MSATITISNLTWRAPNGAGFANLSLTFARERTGLIGRNGTGKTSLLKLITGELAPVSGSISVDGTIGILRQAVNPQPGQTIADLFGLRDALALIARAEAGNATAAELADADWTLEARVAAALAETGITAPPATPLDALSGGQRTRAALAALVFARPDFILLDEPTNNLDRDGRQAIANLLANWKSGAIVISHDRALLEQMDAIVELTSLGATRYGGGWSHYAERKALELAAAQHELGDAQKRVDQARREAQAALERKAQKDSAGRRKEARGDMPKILLGGLKNKAENTSGALSRLAGKLGEEAQASLHAARQKVEVLTPLTVALASTGLPTSKLVLDIRDVTAGYTAGQPILKNFSLTITGPERLAITGPNGSGKSTLLALVTGQFEPWSGSVQTFVKTAMLDQRVDVLDPALSIRDNFSRLNPGTTDNECRAALARFMFRADAALQITRTLSGGQLLRAGLACTIGGASPPQLLILDEPTNYLDIESIEAVEAGLAAFDGALMIVSHDETFLQNVAITRSIALK